MNTRGKVATQSKTVLKTLILALHGLGPGNKGAANVVVEAVL